MASEIRVNKINNRAGLGTITIADTGVVVNGIVTCTEVSGLNVLNIAGVSTFASTLDINGDIDVDGHTNLDNLSIAGVSTFAGAIDLNADLDVDGHTNLDNVSVAGVTTFSDDVIFNGANFDITYDRSLNTVNFDQSFLKFGTSGQLVLRSSGSFSTIDSTAGLVMTVSSLEVKQTSGDKMIKTYNNGAVELYHDDNLRLTTSTKGIQVGTGVTIETNGQATYTGIVTASAFKLSDGSNVGGVESDAQENTVGGTNAGDSFNGTNATKNTLFGYDAGTDLSTGDKNVLIGASAGANLTDSSNAVAIGYEALFSAGASRNYQTAVGYQALRSNAHGQECTAVGYQALYTNNTGDDQCAFGVYSLKNSNGADNTAFGYKSLMDVSGGSQNAAFGSLALENNSSGDYNSAIGYKAGDTLASGNNNTFLGQNSQPSTTSVSNEITLGNANVSHLRIPGIGVSFGRSGATIAGVVTATSFSGDGSSLSNLPAGAPVGGASTNTVFFENDKEVAVNYQITSTKNAMTAGPVAINAGIAVTVPSGCAWTIV